VLAFESMRETERGRDPTRLALSSGNMVGVLYPAIVVVAKS
jgi:hypothetical protein